jgi:DNA modification methylase
MIIKDIALKNIKPYKHNNRIHNDQQIQRIADSIKKFGFNQPIVIDENNEILVGHGRLLAAEKLGLKDAPCIQLTNLSDNEKRAYRILDNKLQNDSAWDFDSLQLEMQELKENDFDMSFCGLEELGKLFPEPEPEANEDDFEPTEPEDIFIKLGDLIELGRHRVMCGDSTDAEQVSDLMDGKQGDLLLTDPPYGLKRFKNGIGKNDRHKNKSDAVFNAEVPSKEQLNGWIKAFPKLIVWGMNNLELPCTESFLVWSKEQTVNNFASAELAWCNLGIPAKVFTYGIHKHNHTKDGGHPTEKPVPLIAWCIKLAKESNLIVDYYLGSGTTLIACEQLNRTCYGMEISPKYCQVILERYKSYCEKNNKPFECKINGENYS